MLTNTLQTATAPPPSYVESIYPDVDDIEKLPPPPIEIQPNQTHILQSFSSISRPSKPAPPPPNLIFNTNAVDAIKPTEKFRRILIPGLGGSKIYCCCNQVEKPKKMYPVSLPGIKPLNNHFFECTQTKTKILKTVMMVSVYRNFIRRTNCESFSYDWRKPVIEHAHNLYSFLVNDDDPTPVILIGHSLGGVIIRVLVEYLRPFHLIGKKIRHVFICGTPLLGSHDTNDYNCELQILPVLMQTQDTVSFQNKPRILRERDIKRFFKYFGSSLMYLMPSFVVEQISPFDKEKQFEKNVLQFGKHTTITMQQFIVLRQVHRCLAKFDFPSNVTYHFFYNVSRKIDVRHAMDRNTIKHISRKTNIKNVTCLNVEDMTWQVVRSLQSDGLILACRKLPANSIVWFDRSFATHSLLMNSPQISTLICQYLNSNDDD